MAAPTDSFLLSQYSSQRIREMSLTMTCSMQEGWAKHSGVTEKQNIYIKLGYFATALLLPCSPTRLGRQCYDAFSQRRSETGIGGCVSWTDLLVSTLPYSPPQSPTFILLCDNKIDIDLLKLDSVSTSTSSGNPLLFVPFHFLGLLTARFYASRFNEVSPRLEETYGGKRANIQPLKHEKRRNFICRQTPPKTQDCTEQDVLVVERRLCHPDFEHEFRQQSERTIALNIETRGMRFATAAFRVVGSWSRASFVWRSLPSHATGLGWSPSQRI
jgi:hypothetical protein